MNDSRQEADDEDGKAQGDEMQIADDEDGKAQGDQIPIADLNTNDAASVVDDDDDNLFQDCIQSPVTTRNYNLRNRTKLKGPDRLIAQANFTEVYEPLSFKDAITGPDSEKWIKATKSELESHQKNNTCSVVHKPENRKLIDSKWLFKVQDNKIGESKDT